MGETHWLTIWIPSTLAFWTSCNRTPDCLSPKSPSASLVGLALLAPDQAAGGYGFIRKRVTLLDATLLGLDFEVYAIVKLSLPSTDNLNIFEAAVAQWPEVVQCATITGREDYVLRIITSDMHAFDQFLRTKLLSLGIVSDCESHIVTRGVKNVTTLPLGIVTPHVG